MIACISAQSDPQAALDFLRWVRPAGPWVLMAIPPEGGVTQTHTFRVHEAEDLMSWVAERSGKLNLYYGINPTSGPLNSKAKKTDVISVEFFHVDVDPEKPTGTDPAALAKHLESERARILGMLEAFQTAPSAIVDSGGGYQALWRLEEPIRVGGVEGLALEAEAYSKQLGVELRGDATHNCDRQLRLPGTINVPDERKRKKGRFERLAVAIYTAPAGDRVYPLSAFPQPAPLHQNRGGVVPAAPVQLSENLPSVNVMTELPESVSPRMRAVIVNGRQVDSERYPTRSEAVWGVTCELVRAGCSDDVIAAVLLDPDYAISESVLEKGGRANAARQIEKARDAVAAAAEAAGVTPFSEDALALTFAARHVEGMRYVAQWRQWMIWDGSRWAADLKRVAFSNARIICREAANEFERVTEDKSGAWLRQASKRKNVLDLASDDQRLAATIDQWDADLEEANTPAGVIDLRTGEMRPHSPRDYMTKITAVAPGGTSETWAAFLDRATGGDREFQSYLKRVAGYCLTGLTTEHALFFIYGPGGNGKSVFMETLSGIVGDYHATAPMETFTATATERHPTDVAGLRGARMVTAVETEDGRRWAESKIKSLTGGDKIAARKMRQDFFTFTPQFKLLVSGNHKPGLSSVDEAMRRRFHLIPFEVTIPKHERDMQLKEKLKAEWPGILAWMIEGGLDWRLQGLAPPAIVRDATDEYMEAEDTFAGWLADCCEVRPDAWASAGRLFESWSDWALRRREWVGTSKRFGDTLRSRGFKAFQRDDRGWLGIQLREARPGSPDQGAPY